MLRLEYLIVIQSISGENIALLVDAADSDDLTISSGVVSGHRLLLANGASAFSINDIEFEGSLSESLAIVDQRCTGTCSWSNIDASNITNGFSLSGSGNHSISSLNLSATERGIEGTGAGHITLDFINLTAGTKGIEFRDPDSNLNEVSVEMTSNISTAYDLLDGVPSMDFSCSNQSFFQPRHVFNRPYRMVCNHRIHLLLSASLWQRDTGKSCRNIWQFLFSSRWKGYWNSFGTQFTSRLIH